MIAILNHNKDNQMKLLLSNQDMRLLSDMALFADFNQNVLLQTGHEHYMKDGWNMIKVKTESYIPFTMSFKLPIFQRLNQQTTEGVDLRQVQDFVVMSLNEPDLQVSLPSTPLGSMVNQHVDQTVFNKVVDSIKTNVICTIDGNVFSKFMIERDKKRLNPIDEFGIKLSKQGVFIVQNESGDIFIDANNESEFNQAPAGVRHDQVANTSHSVRRTIISNSDVNNNFKFAERFPFRYHTLLMLCELEKTHKLVYTIACYENRNSKGENVKMFSIHAENENIEFVILTGVKL
jgi:hypothetical protein